MALVLPGLYSFVKGAQAREEHDRNMLAQEIENLKGHYAAQQDAARTRTLLQATDDMTQARLVYNDLVGKNVPPAEAAAQAMAKAGLFATGTAATNMNNVNAAVGTTFAYSPLTGTAPFNSMAGVNQRLAIGSNGEPLIGGYPVLNNYGVLQPNPGTQGESNLAHFNAYETARYNNRSLGFQSQQQQQNNQIARSLTQGVPSTSNSLVAPSPQQPIQNPAAVVPPQPNVGAIRPIPQTQVTGQQGMGGMTGMAGGGMGGMGGMINPPVNITADPIDPRQNELVNDMLGAGNPLGVY